jgi:hypothetical protein
MACPMSHGGASARAWPICRWRDTERCGCACCAARRVPGPAPIPTAPLRFENLIQKIAAPLFGF